MSSKKSQRLWSMAGIFMIVLILSLPFYSANALAVSLQITKNTGQAGIDQFIDANGDVWTVQATISGIDNSSSASVDPKNLKLKIGDNEAEFTSCSPGSFGMDCQYISPLTDGVKEGEWGFQVIYTYISEALSPKTVSAGSVVKADSSGPKITDFSAAQSLNGDGKVNINFKVSDKYEGKPAVGLKKIEILEAETGTVLQTINEFPDSENPIEYIYSQDSRFSGKLQAELSGEGLKKIKVQAEDLLGHQSSKSELVIFDSDFIVPEIKDNYNFTSLGSFIGKFLVETDLTIDLVDTNLDDGQVTAFSEQIDFGSSTNSKNGECLSDDEVENLWHCIWKSLTLNPLSPIVLKISAKDTFGNLAEKTFTPTFTEDTSAPEIVYFGTYNTFEDKSYVKNGDQKIFLQVKDQGAWIDPKDIMADLSALGEESYQLPDECLQGSEVLECYWKTTKSFTSEGSVSIGISKLEDKVGNVPDLPRIDLFIDNTAPVVKKLEAYGVSDVGEKDYFQSNDKLKLKLRVDENQGVLILVDLNDLVMDAETKYPVTEMTEAGWQLFDGRDVCQKLSDEKINEDYWECQFETEPIKSGPDTNAEVRIKVLDTAGNEAKEWPETAKNLDSSGSSSKEKYWFNLLALSDEANPDYWEVSSLPRMQGLDFVDIDAAKMTYSRAALKINLQSDNPQVHMLKIEPMGECTGVETSKFVSKKSDSRTFAQSAPEISRILFYGNNYPDGQSSPAGLNFVMEFAPISTPKATLGISESDGEFREAIAEYSCKFRIYSRVGNKAIASAEIQEVRVPVIFGYSDLGGMDENLKDRVKDLREGVLTDFGKVLGIIAKVVQWLEYIARWLSVLSTLFKLFELFNVSKLNAAQTADQTSAATFGGTKAFAEMLKGNCFSSQYTGKAKWKFVKYLNVPLQILSCNPQKGEVNLGWYGKYQRAILDIYNIASGRGALGVPASTLYDNIYASVLGLCIPGIVFNLEKAREIYCRKIICYAREVPAGIATIDACNKLHDLQMCEYFWGPVFDFVGLGGLAYIGKMIKSAFSSPLGLISLTEIIACAPLCWKPCVDGCVSLKICKFFTGINKLLELIDGVIGGIKNRPDTTGSPYCKMAEKIKLDELTGEDTSSAEEEPEVAAAEPATAASPASSQPATATS